MHPFRAAIEAEDIEAAVALLAENVEFRSPVVFKPYHGRETVGVLLRAVSRVFSDFRYLREMGTPEGSDHALAFEARVGAKQVEGCDFLHVDEAGAIDQLVVMIRPLSGVLAVAEAMQAELAGRDR